MVINRAHFYSDYSHRTPEYLSISYHLWLFYDNLGFMIQYPGGVRDSSILRVCPVIEFMQAIDLSLQAPNNPLPLDRFDAILEDIRLQTETGKTRGLHTIQEATGMNEKDQSHWSSSTRKEKLITRPLYPILPS